MLLYTKGYKETIKMKAIENIQHSKHGEDTMLDMYLPDCEEFPVFVYFHGGCSCLG